MAKYKEISMTVSKKYSANYNSVEATAGATKALFEDDDVDTEYGELFYRLDKLTDEKVQKLLDEM